MLLGSLIMATLLNGLSLLAVPPEARFIARGVVLAIAAWLDVRLAARRAERTQAGRGLMGCGASPKLG